MTIAHIALLIALGAVVLVLVAGLAVMARGGEASLRYSNKLMQLRVAVQLVAILIIAAILFFSGR